MRRNDLVGPRLSESTGRLALGLVLGLALAVAALFVLLFHERRAA